MGDAGLVARIDIGDGLGGGAGFWMLDDLTGDGEPDLLATSSPGTVYLVPGPITSDVRVEDAAMMVLTTGKGDLQLARIGDTDGDGADEVIVQRGLDGLVRLELPLTGDVELDGMPLAVDFDGHFGSAGWAAMRELGGGIWLYGNGDEDLTEAWQLDGPWDGGRTLADARLHLWATNQASGDQVFGDSFGGQAKPLGDLEGTGASDAGLTNPPTLFDVGVSGDIEVLAPWADGFAFPWNADFSGLGDVTGDGVDDLLVDASSNPGDAVCVIAGPINLDTAGLSTPSADSCALVLESADGGLAAGAAWGVGDVDGDGFGDFVLGSRVLPGGLSGSHDASEVAIATHVAGPVVGQADQVPLLGRLEGRDAGWDFIAHHDPPVAGVSDPPQPEELEWWELVRVVP